MAGNPPSFGGSGGHPCAKRLADHAMVGPGQRRMLQAVRGGHAKRCINNRIKVIKRMAYGYRDTDYFFLKIKAVFRGNA